MASLRLALRSARPSMVFTRTLSSTACRMVGPGNAKSHETGEYRKLQSEKPLNPHMANTDSTIANDMPSVGVYRAPPELLSSVDPNFIPKDSVSENTERMTGGTQKGAPKTSPNSDLGVGEMVGGKFRIEPLRRTGEDSNTMRARLLYQCRKRGTLESDLLMSTFAEAHLRDMTDKQMAQFDLFLDENDWDIYYWATQESSQTSQETAEGAGKGPEGANATAQGTEKASPLAQGTDPGKQTGPELETDAWRNGQPRSGEWAQTVGTFKPQYRPVPARWKNSEILAMLRRHVISKSAGGVHEDTDVSDNGLSHNIKWGGGRASGMAFMPPVFETDRP